MEMKEKEPTGVLIVVSKRLVFLIPDSLGGDLDRLPETVRCRLLGFDRDIAFGRGRRSGMGGRAAAPATRFGRRPRGCGEGWVGNIRMDWLMD